MQTKDALRTALKMTKDYTTALAADMADQPLLRSNPETGHHAYWLLGHMVFSEGCLLDEFLLGQPNRYAAWAQQFGTGSKPADTMEGGPSYRELLTEFETIRASLREHFESMTDDDLAQPCHNPAGHGPPLNNNLEALTVVSTHLMFHAGQMAEVRRADGRRPLIL